MEERRGGVRVAAAAALSAAAAASPACEPELAGAGLERIESKGYVLAFRTDPRNLVPGKHFALDIAVCARPGAAAPALAKVDAHMPEHRHGMNYAPSITRRGPLRWRAEGLLLHMPGRWEWVFELRAGDAIERLTHSRTLD
jgi:hypothetical protein